MTPTEFHASVRPLLHFDRNGLWGDVINPREDQVPLLVNPVQYGVDRIEDGGWVVLRPGTDVRQTRSSAVPACISRLG